MGIWGKLIGKEPMVQSEEPEDNKSAASKPRNRKDTLASVLQETVPQKVQDELKKNTKFVTKRDGDVLYTVIVFDVAAIGGLSQKTTKEEDKGALVESMKSGRIKIMLTGDLIDRDEIVVIPEPVTLDAIDDFGIIRDSTYKIAFVDTDGDLEYTESTVVLDTLKSVSEGRVPIDRMLLDCGVEGFDVVNNAPAEDVFEDPFASVSSPEPPPVNNDFVNDFSNFENDPDDVLPFGDDPVSNDNGNFSDYRETGDNDFAESSYDDVYSDTVDDSDDFVPDESDGFDSVNEFDNQGSSEPEEDIVPDAVLNATIIRRFYSEDLGLEVTTEPFDQQFIQNNELVLFDENRGDGWLNGYLSQMSKDANMDLRSLRAIHIKKLRDLYIQLMSLHCDKVRDELDDTNPDTDMYKFKQAIDEAKRNSDDKTEAEVSQKQDEIKAEWEKKLKDVGQKAYDNAVQAYEVRYIAEHKSQLNAIENSVRVEKEGQYQDALRAYRERRRKTAQEKFDKGVDATLAVIKETYESYQKDEQELYQEWQKKISDFTDSNRKEEIARTKTLDEDLRQTDRADNVRRELTAKLESLTADFNAMKTRLSTELEETKRKDSEVIQHNEATYNKKIADMQSNIDSLLAKYADLDEQKKQEYESRLHVLERDKHDLQDQVDHIISVHKRSNIIMVALTIIAVITAAAIGIIVGMRSNSDYIVDATNQAVTSNIEAYFDKLETSSVTESEVESDTDTDELDRTYYYDDDDTYSTYVNESSEMSDEEYYRQQERDFIMSSSAYDEDEDEEYDERSYSDVSSSASSVRSDNESSGVSHSSVSSRTAVSSSVSSVTERNTSDK